jgi:hypothetical protein
VCAALNVVSGAMRSAQANARTGLTSSALTASTVKVIYVKFPSITLKFGQTCYYFHIFCSSNNFIIILLLSCVYFYFLRSFSLSHYFLTLLVCCLQ